MVPARKDCPGLRVDDGLSSEKNGPEVGPGVGYTLPTRGPSLHCEKRQGIFVYRDLAGMCLW
jgi:hypothetical protein